MIDTIPCRRQYGIFTAQREVAVSGTRGDRYGEWEGRYSTDLISARRRQTALPDPAIAATAIETAPGWSGEPPLTPSEARPRRFRAVLSVTVAGLLVTVIAVTATYQQHARVTPSLTSARSELSRELVQSSADQSQLDSTDGQVDAAERSLASDTALLTKDRAQLADTEARTDLQGVNIADLHLCLAGVERALNQFALGDRTGAITILGTVTSSCRGAGPVGT